MKHVPHTAMILAAGLGTRMRPLTLETAKPLIRINDRALIDRILTPFIAVGVTRFVVNTHWQADLVEAHFKSGFEPDIQIIISDERDLLMDTGGALAKAAPLLGEAPIFVANTDAFWEPSSPSILHKMVDQFDPERMDELLLLADTHRSLGYAGTGDFFLSSNMELTRRGKASTAPWAYTGIRLLKPETYKDEPIRPFSAVEKWQAAIAENRLFGMPLDAFWLHVGTPQAVEDAQMWLRCHGE